VTLGLDADFRAATAAMSHCLDIRNQYAHWIWWDDNSGQLALANIEDIAKMAMPVNELAQLNPGHFDAALLHEPGAYFVYTDLLDVGELRRSSQSGENRAGSA
jgi:hypothetical protein